MEGLADLVTESLVRHGFTTTFDHRRLQWSKWFPCRDRFSLLLVPCKPGLYALGEEVAAFGAASELHSYPEHTEALRERNEGSPDVGKRLLALFEITEADDLGMALGRLFLAPSPQRERFATGKCFARYVVIEDQAQRRAAHTALQRWMSSSAEALAAPNSASLRPSTEQPGFVSGYGFSHTANPTPLRSALAAAHAQSAEAHGSSNEQAQIGPPAAIPSGF